MPDYKMEITKELLLEKLNEAIDGIRQCESCNVFVATIIDNYGRDVEIQIFATANEDDFLGND